MKYLHTINRVFVLHIKYITYNIISVSRAAQPAHVAAV